MMNARPKQPYLKEWLRTASGINKKYFEGEAYKELRLKVKKSSRYARSEFKDMVHSYFPFR